MVACSSTFIGCLKDASTTLIIVSDQVPSLRNVRMVPSADIFLIPLVVTVYSIYSVVLTTLPFSLIISTYRCTSTLFSVGWTRSITDFNFTVSINGLSFHNSRTLRLFSIFIIGIDCRRCRFVIWILFIIKFNSLNKYNVCIVFFPVSSASEEGAQNLYQNVAHFYRSLHLQYTAQVIVAQKH
jgi:hypothetical protein